MIYTKVRSFRDRSVKCTFRNQSTEETFFYTKVPSHLAFIAYFLGCFFSVCQLIDQWYNREHRRQNPVNIYWRCCFLNGHQQLPLSAWRGEKRKIIISITDCALKASFHSSTKKCQFYGHFFTAGFSPPAEFDKNIHLRNLDSFSLKKPFKIVTCADCCNQI